MRLVLSSKRVPKSPYIFWISSLCQSTAGGDGLVMLILAHPKPPSSPSPPLTSLRLYMRAYLCCCCVCVSTWYGMVHTQGESNTISSYSVSDGPPPLPIVPQQSLGLWYQPWRPGLAGTADATCFHVFRKLLLFYRERGSLSPSADCCVRVFG